MEKGKISRKHVKGAHGQVMQVVENVYDEAHKELPPFIKEKMEQKKKGLSEDHDEAMTDTEVMEKSGGDGGPSADHSELDYADGTGRYETARSSDDGYADRMKVGKAGASGEVGRMKTAKSSLQDQDRLDTPKSAEQDDDRTNTAKVSMGEAEGESRWAGQADGHDQVNNMDQYDVGANDYPEPNRPKTSSGTDPYGRDETETKMPTESEEMPDDEVFAVETTNVMADKNMRVLRQTSSQGRQPVKGGKIADFQEPQPAEETSELGVTAHGEGAGKPSKEKQLTPGAMDSIDEPAETVGPDGAFSERGEKKSTDKHLTPGAFGDVDEPAEEVGPKGAGFAEVKTGKKQLTPGAMDKTDVPAETSKKSGGVFSEEHAEGKKDPYTKTGFGSTYEEGEGDEGVDEGEEDYNELSVDHCGMNYGMGSMSQAKAVGFPEQMYEELMSLKQKYAELERRHAEEKLQMRREKLANFVETLYTEGRLTDGVIPEKELISYCEGLEFGTLEFAEGETSATKLLNLLSKLPPMVSFGEVAGGTFQYAEESDLDPHSKALKMVEESDGNLDYVEALKKAMYS